jgi:hypothetical protein
MVSSRALWSSPVYCGSRGSFLVRGRKLGANSTLQVMAQSSVTNATMRMVPPQLGHTSGSVS